MQTLALRDAWNFTEEGCRWLGDLRNTVEIRGQEWSIKGEKAESEPEHSGLGHSDSCGDGDAAGGRGLGMQRAQPHRTLTQQQAVTVIWMVLRPG